MDRAAALARLNRRLLEQFSGRTVGALRAVLPMRIALPHLEPFLARNLEKEASKDALVVRCAGDALARGSPPSADAASKLLGAARDIDREFLGRVADFPVRIHVPYARIEPLRLRRIQRGLALAWRILNAWQARRHLRDEIPRAELARELREMLFLYCEETAALSYGVRVPALLAPLRERLNGLLLRHMRQAAERLTADIAAQKRS